MMPGTSWSSLGQPLRGTRARRGVESRSARWTKSDHHTFCEDQLSSDFTFEVNDSERVRVVALYGQLDLANAERVRESLVGVAGDAVVVDLSGLRFLDSSGIAAILAARREIVDAGHGFELRGATGIVRRVLEVTGLTFLLSD